ncbi:MAG: HlyD family efflux transporter periplasmic adaptor subunit [Magnetococcales bacterium]|nr:efflux RND transporter periplasmic adaptor subunit [Magnetococcales bacterium]NGZ27383.1 HlyD family efflux transporter periplasmic adaptor subunit [Magnetococcales bacterium]
MTAESDSITHLYALATFDGPPATFWPRYLESVADLSQARRVMVLAHKEGAWRVFQQFPARLAGSEGELTLVQRLAERASTTPFVQEEHGLAFRLSDNQEETTLLVILLAQNAPPVPLVALRLAAQIPPCYQNNRQLQHLHSKSERLFNLLSQVGRLGNERRFIKAALMLCNDMASRYECDRVSLGWLKGAHIHLQAISHVEKFDRKMTASRQLEQVMEEALDQDEDLLFPKPANSSAVVRAHEVHARAQGSDHLVSLPLRQDGSPVAVVTVERRKSPFTVTEVWEMRLLVDAIAGLLHHLHTYDRWWGARAVTAAKHALDHFWGVEHSLTKLVSFLVVFTLLALSLIPWPYRVEAPFTLRSQDIAYLSAPFDGYLQEVVAEMGDEVKEGDLLATLDIHELLLEQASVAADVTRYGREAEKAKSVDSLADMQIALARRDQSMARLDLLRHNLSRAKVRSPMSGVVVEGNLKEKLSAPVRKGDLLFKVARIARTYVELEIPETDIHEIQPDSRGEIAFVGRPDIRFAIHLTRLEPVATLKSGKNVFLARATIQETAEDWWRPGMGGSAKVNVGDRPLLWIFTHRTLRFLQKVFWL